MKPKSPDIHDIKKGQIAFVCHDYILLPIVVFIKVWDLQERNTVILGSGYPRFENHPLKLAPDGIPHGTPVLVTEEAKVLYKTYAGESHWYYRILWGELDCWVRREKLINPYFNGSPIPPASDTD